MTPIPSFELSLAIGLTRGTIVRTRGLAREIRDLWALDSERRWTIAEGTDVHACMPFLWSRTYT